MKTYGEWIELYASKLRQVTTHNFVIFQNSTQRCAAWQRIRPTHVFATCVSAFTFYLGAFFFTITGTGVLWPPQLGTTRLDVQRYNKMSRGLHTSSPRGGFFPDTQESQGSSNSNGILDACEWYSFPSPAALFPSEEQLEPAGWAPGPVCFW